MRCQPANVSPGPFVTQLLLALDMMTGARDGEGQGLIGAPERRRQRGAYMPRHVEESASVSSTTPQN